MIKKFFFLFILVFQIAFGGEADIQFEQANLHYRNGEYEQAKNLYEQVVKNGYEHADLFYNLGNAYYKLKNYPSAILNYERAKKLSPDDEEIIHNLTLSNLHVVDKIEPIPSLFFVQWWEGFVSLYPANRWAIIAIVSLWITVILVCLMLVLRSDILRRVLLLLSLLSFVVTIASYVVVIQRNHLENKQQFAIVFAPSVSIKSSPDIQGTDLFVIHDGVKAEILDTVGEWKKIKLADGKIGWMKADGLQVI